MAQKEGMKEQSKKEKDKDKIETTKKQEKKPTERVKEEVISEKEQPEASIKKEVLTNDEKQMLVVLDFVQKHKISLKITGFKIKDFLEKIFPDKEIYEIYSKLRDKDLVSKTKDTEELWITYKGSEEAAKHQDLLKNVFRFSAPKIGEFLEKSELLRRILYLAYMDEWKVRSYIPKISDKLSDIEQVLVTFFLSREFLQLPTIEKIVRRSRNEQPQLIKERLEEFCKDLDFLKSLAVLRLEEIRDKIGVDAVASIRYKNYFDVIPEIIEKKKASDILSRLSMLGVSESEILFNIDLDSVLTKEENLLRLKEWLTFDKAQFRDQLKDDWNLFLNIKRVIESSTPSDFKELINANAVIPYRDKLLVRKEAKEIYEEIYEEIEKRLKEKVKDIDNVIVLPFYEKEKLKDVEGKIVISLHAEDWWSQKYYPDIREDELEKNVILLVSPKEVGFKIDKERILSSAGSMPELPYKNVELNAIGEIENLDKVKSKFSTCDWVLEEEYYSVKRAEEMIWEKEHPPISLEEAINELKEGYDGIDGKILIDALLIAVNTPTNYSGIFVYTDYRKFDKKELWRFVEEMLKLKYDVNRENFKKIKERLEEVIEQKARIDLLILGLDSRPGANVYHEKKKDILSTICRNYDVRNNILSPIKNLDQKSKEILWIYMNFFINDSPIDFSRFKIFYESIFYRKLENIGDMLNTINKSGISIAKEEYNYPFQKINNYPFPFVIENDLISELLDMIKRQIQIKIPEIEHFAEKYKNNITELIGLDYLLSVSGICERDELREFLWKIALEAWNKFESYDRIISSKDEKIIVINPLILEKLKKFVINCKKQLLRNGEKLRDLVLSLKIIDHKIEFDEELGIYRGFIITSDKEEIKVIIAPWYLPAYEKYFGKKTILMITNQEEYETFADTIKEKDEKITLFFFEKTSFSIYSSFDKYGFINSVISRSEGEGYKLKNKELEFEEISEEKEEIISEEEIIEPLTEGKEQDILDYIFVPLGRKRISSLFGVTSHKPYCIIVTGDRKQGKKIIEDLVKDEFVYWGNYTPKVKQIDGIMKDKKLIFVIGGREADPREVVESISEEDNRVVSINLPVGYTDWVEKIVEKLKEVETQGLKYVILYIEEKVPKTIIEKIDREVSIPSYILDLPSGEKVSKIKQQLLALFGEGIGTRIPIEIDNLDAFWNHLQREMGDITNEMNEKIDRDDELKNIILLEEEFSLHYVLRGLTCKYLRQSGYQVNVETTEDKIVPDLTAFKKGEKLFVEVETCVPTRKELDEHGFIHPEERLKKKLNKYKKVEKGGNLILVVPNIFALTHKTNLQNIKNYLKKIEIKASIHIIDWSSYPAKLVRMI